MIPSYIKLNFPGLRTDSDADVLKPESERYNCIMYVIGGKYPNIWPMKERPITRNDVNELVFWPTDLSAEETLDNFLKFFEKFKYELCGDDSYEDGYRKIAIFCQKDSDVVTHAALMYDKVFWTSKMGHGALIKHKLYSLDGGAYGRVRCFMKRPNTITKEFDMSVIQSYIINTTTR